jgi:hypothetical protein
MADIEENAVSLSLVSESKISEKNENMIVL